MSIKNASPGLYNEDLAPAKERNWGAFSIFNVWTSDVHSLWGYYLAASLFLICGSFVNFIIAIGLGSVVIYILMNLIGNAGAQIRRTPPGRVNDYHTASRRQYVITLSGHAELVLSGGQTIQVGPGSIELAEDLTGKGHITRTVGTEDRVAIVIPVAGKP